MVDPPPCDLDGRVFNLASAWWGPPSEWFPSGWRALMHGAGPVDTMLECGCQTCLERVELLEQRAEFLPEPEPRRVDVAPARRRIEELLGLGWTHRRIAEDAGIDRTTIGRALRGDVHHVHVDTAAALLSVEPRVNGHHPGTT